MSCLVLSVCLSVCHRTQCLPTHTSVLDHPCAPIGHLLCGLSPSPTTSPTVKVCHQTKYLWKCCKILQIYLWEYWLACSCHQHFTLLLAEIDKKVQKIHPTIRKDWNIWEFEGMGYASDCQRELNCIEMDGISRFNWTIPCALVSTHTYSVMHWFTSQCSCQYLLPPSEWGQHWVLSSSVQFTAWIHSIDCQM